ncbi:MAG: tRNA pseudouridine(38-40) synthase TruA [Clostridia bacterium]|nr:tRNA pseudouridine(38-40) synthase TruA [Clostridia bacterium]MBQ3127600.1 tRNA pseudouridine(38-40) synthase TruA [Clostridia bacterium]MBQ7043261.1 tRNA pseudouridine(38-40) synthase TruA [Clostridia bacterium]
MRNLLLRLMYDGSHYHGWQVQPNGITVQETLQDAIEQILGVRENVTGCSRTDAGVHANDFCCNIRTENEIDCYRLQGALNAVLPESISVKSVSEVELDFHARYNCVTKQYVYRVWNASYKNPFLVNRAWHYKNKIDENFLNGQAQAYIGTHDFKAFCSAGSTVEDTVRTVKSFSVTRDGEEVLFTVEADGFLYNMVRIMVGSLIEISENKIEKDKLSAIIESKDRALAGRTAPAQGLFLNKVKYGEV